MHEVTIGGVTIGLCLAGWQLVIWWPGYKALTKDPIRYVGSFLPFLASGVYGVLAILTIGGLLGWIADTTLWITNWLGDAALVWGIGGHAGTSASGHGYLPLTQTGGAIVLILTAVVAAAARRPKSRGHILRGVWCGICLGTSAGVAGFAAVPIAEAANWVGGIVYGVVV